MTLKHLLSPPQPRLSTGIQSCIPEASNGKDGGHPRGLPCVQHLIAARVEMSDLKAQITPPPRMPVAKKGDYNRDPFLKMDPNSDGDDCILRVTRYFQIILNTKIPRLQQYDSVSLNVYTPEV